MYLVAFSCRSRLHGLVHIGWAGCITAKPGDLRRHAHDNGYEFHRVETAEGVFIAGESALRTRSNDLFLSPPGEFHEPWPAVNRGATRLHFILFIPDASDDGLMTDVSRRFADTHRVQVNTSVLHALDRIRGKIHDPQPHLRASAVHELLALLHELAAADRASPSAAASNTIDQLVRIMRDNVTRTLRLDDAARRLKINKCHLIRSFTRRMDMPPLRYFVKLKIETACHWLQWSDAPVHRIAERLSFYDESHFSRTFKRVTALWPTEYRRQSPTAVLAPATGKETRLP